MKTFRSPLSKTYIMNTASIHLLYMFFVISKLQQVIKSYKKIVIYYNINKKHILRRIFSRKLIKHEIIYKDDIVLIKSCSKIFKKLYLLSNVDERTDLYSYIDIFKKYIKNYKINEKIQYYDYDMDRINKLKSFIIQLSKTQSRLNDDILKYIHINILLMIKNDNKTVQINFTDTCCIDFSRYNLCRFIRSRKWFDTSQKEHIIDLSETSLYNTINKSFYEQLVINNIFPLLDIAIDNSYDIFIQNSNPNDLFMKNINNLMFDDEFTNEDTELNELTKEDINILYENIKIKWKSHFPLFDINKFKI